MDDRVLYERFHAALDIEPRPDAYDRFRKALTQARIRPWQRHRFGIALPRSSRRLIAAALTVALAAAAIPAFLALHRYAQQVTTTRKHPSSSTCVPGLHMVTDTIGWQSAGRTTDGGRTWRDSHPAEPPNFSKSGGSSCTLDSNHAWTTQTTGPSLTQSTQLYVFGTADGGQTWQKSTPVPAGGGWVSVALEFIDAQKGWLLTDTGSDAAPPLTRTLYSTSDGGLHWSRVASGSLSGGSILGKLASGCAESGMTFISTEKGWLTWDCSRSNGPSPVQSSGPVVAATNDGGRSWAAVRLPSFPATADWSCGASPPIFSGGQGVILVSCGGTGHNGWAGVYRTSDAGASWTLGKLPFWVQLSQVDFVDATTGFLFGGGVATSDLYRTTNAGRDWILVKKNVFLGQSVGIFQFIDASTGYASTAASQGALLKTTDGGLTWSLPGSSTTIPQNPACGLPPNPRAGGPIPIKMVSPTTGWAFGALRTTDGGTNWLDVAPASVPYRSSGYAEFFLDANHAWVAEGAGSSTACADHIVTFATADGGQTWRKAAPIPVTVDPREVLWRLPTSFTSPSVHTGPYLSFVDAQHGWLLVVSGGIMSGHDGPLYRTMDGGMHWKLVTNDPSSVAACPNQGGGLGPIGAGGISFATASTGFMQGPHCEVGYTGVGGPNATYDPSKAPDQTPQQLVTHDGGVTWRVQRLAAAQCCGVSLPVFFDQSHGMIFNGSANALLVTSDGGDTWSLRTMPVDAVSFINPNEGWGIATDWQSRSYARLFHTGDGGKTWTIVNARVAPADPPGGSAYIEGGVLAATSLSFVDGRNGFWATGSNTNGGHAQPGKLYKTTDGGHTWVAVQARVG